jgi:hypothetical protein
VAGVGVVPGVAVGLDVGVAVGPVRSGEQLARREAATKRTLLSRRWTTMNGPVGLCMLPNVYRNGDPACKFLRALPRDKLQTLSELPPRGRT